MSDSLIIKIELKNKLLTEKSGFNLQNILFRYKTCYGILELIKNNEILYPEDDNKTLGQTDGRDRIVSLNLKSIPWHKVNPSLDNISSMASTASSYGFK